MAGPVPRGSLAPLVTPFRDGVIDYDAFEELIEAQIEAGSHGIVVAGTTGEPGTLATEEREELAEVAVRVVAGRLPVVVGTGTAELPVTLRLTRHAHEIGAAAALVVTPYYVRPSQHGLVDWFTRVAGETDLPIILYDIPGRAGVALSIDTIVTLSALPNVVAVKEARADLEHASRVIAACGPEFGVYCGVETLCYPMLSLGGSGHVSATANVAPREMAAMADAAFAGDWERARAIHFELLELNEAVFADTNPVPIKTMLGALGAIQPDVRPPLAPLLPDVRERVLDVLERYRDRSAATPA